MRVTGFLRETRGSMTYTAMGFVFVTLAVGGVAVDVMRHEGTRAKVQQTLDACTASVGVVEPADATNEALKTAVADCMARGGVPDSTATVTAAKVSGVLTTSATGAQTNFFMQMANGSATTTYSSQAAATVASSPVEVVLAYEASNAMTAAGLTTAFRAGANAFVDIVSEAGTTNTNGLRPQTSIGLVPYTDGVNLPAALLARYNVTNVSTVTNSNCIDLRTTDFGLTAFSTGAVPAPPTYQTMMMSDLASPTSTLSATAYVTSTSPNATVGTTSVPCPPYAGNVLRTPTNLASAVKSSITTSQFFGGLRWDHGMHWASAMLDPATNSAISPLLPADINTRPLAYNTTKLQKVIVFVNRSGTGSNAADGSQQIMAPAFSTGLSPIWRNSTVSPATYCINLPARPVTPRFFQPAIVGSAAWTTACPVNFVQLTWPQVWRSVRASWVAWQLYARGMQSTATPTLAAVQATYTTTFASFWTSIPFETQRAQFESECAAAKAQGIVIYTVALDAIARAKGPLQTCATSPAHYFDTTAANFSSVMTTIAQTIKQQANPQ